LTIGGVVAGVRLREHCAHSRSHSTVVLPAIGDQLAPGELLIAGGRHTARRTRASSRLAPPPLPPLLATNSSTRTGGQVLGDRRGLRPTRSSASRRGCAMRSSERLRWDA
jgi:hypothetical protein